MRPRSKKARAKKPRQRRRVRRRREWPDDLTWQDRLSDRLDPVFVRDLQQATHGVIVRAAMVLLGSILAVRLTSLPTSQRVTGTTAYEATVVAKMQQLLGDLWGMLLLVTVLIVPLRAFLSMRDEVAPAATEQLALSNLSPVSVFRAKLGASLVLLGLFVGMFAPAFALIAALRGVEVEVMLALLWIAAWVSISCTCAAVAFATVCRRSGGVRNVVLGVVAAVLTLFGFALYDSHFALLRSIESASRHSPWALWIGPVIPGLVLAGFCAAASSAAFSHDFENRVTRLRALVIASLLAVTLSGVGFGFGGGVIPLLCVLFVGAFGCFAATEDAGMSRIVRTQLPAGSVARLACAPFLPGRGRGMVFALLAVLAADLLSWWLLDPGPRGVLAVHLAALFSLALAGFGCALRERGMSMSSARASLLGGVVVASMVPLCWNAARGLPLSAWTSIEFVSPFRAMDRALREGVRTYDAVAIGVLALIAVVLAIPSMVRGLREVAQRGEAVEEAAA